MPTHHRRWPMYQHFSQTTKTAPLPQILHQIPCEESSQAIILSLNQTEG